MSTPPAAAGSATPASRSPIAVRAAPPDPARRRDVFATQGFSAPASTRSSRAHVSRAARSTRSSRTRECLLAVYTLGLERFGAAIAAAAARTAALNLDRRR